MLKDLINVFKKTYEEYNMLKKSISSIKNEFEKVKANFIEPKN